MKINKVLYLLRDRLENLPPSMSQILTLCQSGLSVTVVTTYASQYIRDFYKTANVEFVTLEKRYAPGNSVFDKARNLLNYIKLVNKEVMKNSFDLLWIGSADTARYCKKSVITPKPSVLNIYELYDRQPQVIKAITPVAQNTDYVIVPEYNRAHILKVWLGLTKTPTVIPNKPCFPEVEILPETKRIVDEITALNKKVILYQGWIGKDRDVTKIAEALGILENKDDFALVLLGSVVSDDMIENIKGIFKNTIHIPFLQPPQHLFVTETAHIGIATYDDSSLNNIFCAPNKIYEYAEKNVPVLARDIPGLSGTIGKFGAGVCVDMDNADAIAKAIQKICDNYTAYTSSLQAFLNEYSVENTINEIIRSFEGK